jgi:hypothetical protein
MKKVTIEEAQELFNDFFDTYGDDINGIVIVGSSAESGGYPVGMTGVFCKQDIKFIRKAIKDTYKNKTGAIPVGPPKGILDLLQAITGQDLSDMAKAKASGMTPEEYMDSKGIGRPKSPKSSGRASFSDEERDEILKNNN